jgi:flagellar protein FliO/FliZ
MNTVEMIGRLLVSLAAVLGIMWLIARRARKGIKGKSTRVIEVLDRASLTRGASVAVVRVNDQAFVLGIAEAQVSILGETDLAAARAAHDSAVTPLRGRRRADRPAAATPAAASAAVAASAVPASAAARVSKPLSAPPARPGGGLAGSALSPQTWKQTIESLRDLTARP